MWLELARSEVHAYKWPLQIPQDLQPLLLLRLDYEKKKGLLDIESIIFMRR
jgi:hypothetical protein